MWFAWDLMNCVFEDIGKKKYICKSKYIKLCTSKLPDSILQVYTQYLNSIDEKCFYYDLSVFNFNFYQVYRSGKQITITQLILF